MLTQTQMVNLGSSPVPTPKQELEQALKGIQALLKLIKFPPQLVADLLANFTPVTLNLELSGPFETLYKTLQLDSRPWSAEECVLGASASSPEETKDPKPLNLSTVLALTRNLLQQESVKRLLYLHLQLHFLCFDHKKHDKDLSREEVLVLSTQIDTPKSLQQLIVAIVNGYVWCATAIIENRLKNWSITLDDINDVIRQTPTKHQEHIGRFIEVLVGRNVLSPEQQQELFFKVAEHNLIATLALLDHGDVEIEARKEVEYYEPGYTAWDIANVHQPIIAAALRARGATIPPDTEIREPVVPAVFQPEEKKPPQEIKITESHPKDSLIKLMRDCLYLLIVIGEEGNEFPDLDDLSDQAQEFYGYLKSDYKSIEQTLTDVMKRITISFPITHITTTLRHALLSHEMTKSALYNYMSVNAIQDDTAASKEAAIPLLCEADRDSATDMVEHLIHIDKPACVASYLQHGVDPQAKVHGHSLLTTCVIHDRSKILEIVLAHTKHPQQERETAFLYAVVYGHIACAAVLLDPDIVNACDADNYTALMRAAMFGHLQIVDLLLQQNADVYFHRTNFMGVRETACSLAEMSLQHTQEPQLQQNYHQIILRLKLREMRLSTSLNSWNKDQLLQLCDDLASIIPTVQKSSAPMLMRSEPASPEPETKCEAAAEQKDETEEQKDPEASEADEACDAAQREKLGAHINRNINFLFHQMGVTSFKNLEWERLLRQPAIMRKLQRIDTAFSQEPTIGLLCKVDRQKAYRFFTGAAGRGFHRCVATFIANGADPLKNTAESTNALREAVRWNQAEVVKVIMKTNYSRVSDKVRDSLVNMCCERLNPRFEALREIIAVFPQLPLALRRKIFMAALSIGAAKNLEIALEIYQPTERETLQAIFDVIEDNDHDKVMSMLLEYAATILNNRNIDTHTPLTFATMNLRRGIVIALVAGGADPTQTFNGRTVREWVAFNVLYNKDPNPHYWQADFRAIAELLTIYEYAWRHDQHTAVAKAQTFLAEQGTIQTLWQNCISILQLVQKPPCWATLAERAPALPLVRQLPSKIRNTEPFLAAMLSQIEQEMSREKELSALAIVALLTAAPMAEVKSVDSTEERTKTTIFCLQQLRDWLFQQYCHPQILLPKFQWDIFCDPEWKKHNEDPQTLAEYPLTKDFIERCRNLDEQTSKSRFLSLLCEMSEEQTRTLFNFALCFGLKRTISCLIEKEVKINSTCLELAATHDQESSIRILLQRCSDISDAQIQAAFLQAVRVGAFNASKVLTQDGCADADLPNTQGVTPLMEMVIQRNSKTVKYLIIVLGVDPTLQFNGKTALDIAQDQGTCSTDLAVLHIYQKTWVQQGREAAMKAAAKFNEKLTRIALQEMTFAESIPALTSPSTPTLQEPPSGEYKETFNPLRSATAATSPAFSQTTS